MYLREQTRKVMVGQVPIGGGSPIVIQSMCNTDTRHAQETVAQILALEKTGCEMVRVAVPDETAARTLSEIKRQIHIPLVADIHFDYRLALLALEAGADKIRINPGNIGGQERVRAVVEACRHRRVPIRIGVNAGSLEPALKNKYGGVTAQALVESAMGHVRLLEEEDFHDIVISIKASEVTLCRHTYRLLAEQVAYPLHVGVTEAGTVYQGTVKSAVGIGAILADGIGDTIRVSLTGDPVEEIRAAKAILQALELRCFGPTLISCPTCGRTQIDLIGLANEVEKRLAEVKKPITVAVMGCAVNGPGEARQADIGIAGGKGEGLLFQKGQILRKVKEEDLVEALMQEIHK